MRETKTPSRFTDDLDHYLVVFKEDNVKAIVSHGEIRDCDDIVRGASCEALWKDAKHKEWYPAFIVDIGDLEYLRSMQSKPKGKNQKSRTTASKTAGTKESAKKRKTPVQEVQCQEVQSGSEEEQQKKKQSEMRIEAKAKKAVNAKATKDALLKRRLEQAKQFEGYKVRKPSANSGMCSQGELPYEDVSEDRVHEVQSENDREEERVKTKDISSDAKGKKAVNKKATKGTQWRKSLEIATSEVHSQEVLSNDDTSNVESICSLPKNQRDDCSLVHVDDYYATSDDEDETVSDELHSSPLKELFQKGASSSSTPSRKRPASDASSKKKQAFVQSQFADSKCP
ncbi:transcriptional regulator ATRX homolog [Montipora foliosa]|uniref:transcriptional regulator ATRX homolog n=1 Tax=Montipora foliosa TaxID=591990 RepID=UPI0035F0FEF1